MLVFPNCKPPLLCVAPGNLVRERNHGDEKIMAMIAGFFRSLTVLNLKPNMATKLHHSSFQGSNVCTQVAA